MQCANVFAPENDVPELSEQSALQWFRKEICKHFLGGAALNLDSFGFQTIFDPETAVVHVFRLLAAGSFSILFDFDGALVILTKDIFFDFET